RVATGPVDVAARGLEGGRRPSHWPFRRCALRRAGHERGLRAAVAAHVRPWPRGGNGGEISADGVQATPARGACRGWPLSRARHGAGFRPLPGGRGHRGAHVAFLLRGHGARLGSPLARRAVGRAHLDRARSRGGAQAARARARRPAASERPTPHHQTHRVPRPSPDRAQARSDRDGRTMTLPEIALPSEEATVRLAQLVAPLLRAGDLLVLTGGLGAGKTYFAGALCHALGLDDDEPVTSPTFALVCEYDLSPVVLHADLYRLEDERDVFDLGLWERREGGALLLVEWGRSF